MEYPPITSFRIPTQTHPPVSRETPCIKYI
jgi:hypothetical protein